MFLFSIEYPCENLALSADNLTTRRPSHVVKEHRINTPNDELPVTGRADDVEDVYPESENTARELSQQLSNGPDPTYSSFTWVFSDHHSSMLRWLVDSTHAIHSALVCSSCRTKRKQQNLILIVLYFVLQLGYQFHTFSIR
jgi:hypothetical protein